MAQWRPAGVGEKVILGGATYNSIGAVVRAFQAGELGGKGGKTAGRRARQVELSVTNTTGGNLGRFAVVGIDGPSVTPAVNETEFENNLVLDVVTPVAGTHEGKFAVLLEAIPAGKIGRACVAGVVQCTINVADVTCADFADVADGVTGSLSTCTGGSAAVLWRAGGTGSQWAVVRLGGYEKPVMLQAGADMRADDTLYTCRRLYANGALGGEVQCVRPPGVPVRYQDVGTLERSEDGKRVFMPGDTYQVKVSSNDTTPRFLYEKLTSSEGPGESVYFAVFNEGSDEKVNVRVPKVVSTDESITVTGGTGAGVPWDLAVAGSGLTDEKVASADGEMAGFLGEVLQCIDGSVTVATSGAHVNLSVDTGYATEDEKVKADEDDPTADYLDGKVEESITVDTDNHALRLVNDEATPGSDPEYYGYAGETPAKGWQTPVSVAVITSIGEEVTSGDIHYKTKTIKVFEASAESDWGSIVDLYVIAASSGANGTIVPTGNVLVVAGANRSFAIGAVTDYQIEELLVDTVEVGAAAGETSYNYPFTNVQADHTISVTFEATPAGCPDNCTACDDDNLLFVTITGMAGTCYYGTPPHEGDCSGWNGAVQLERANSATCKWELAIANTHVVLECTDAQWLYSQTNPRGGYCVRFTATNTTGCPPLVGWTPDTDGSTCDVSAAELTLSWD